MENYILTVCLTENIITYLIKKIDWGDIDSTLNIRINFSLSFLKTLLATLDLENDILTEFPTENITSYLNKKIDWADIDSKLNDKRNISLSFLKNCF